MHFTFNSVICDYWLLVVFCQLCWHMSSYSTQTLTSLFTEWLIHLRMHKTASTSRHIAQTYSDLIIFRFLYTSFSEITLANARSSSPKVLSLHFYQHWSPATGPVLFSFTVLCDLLKYLIPKSFLFFTRLSVNLFPLSFSSQKVSIYLVIPIQ